MSSNSHKPIGDFRGEAEVKNGFVTFSNRQGKQIHFHPQEPPFIVLQLHHNTEAIFVNTQEKFDELYKKLVELYDSWI